MRHRIVRALVAIIVGTFSLIMSAVSIANDSPTSGALLVAFVALGYWSRYHAIHAIVLWGLVGLTAYDIVLVATVRGTPPDYDAIGLSPLIPLEAIISIVVFSFVGYSFYLLSTAFRRDGVDKLRLKLNERDTS